MHALPLSLLSIFHISIRVALPPPPPTQQNQRKKATCILHLTPLLFSLRSSMNSCQQEGPFHLLSFQQEDMLWTTQCLYLAASKKLGFFCYQLPAKKSTSSSQLPVRRSDLSTQYILGGRPVFFICNKQRYLINLLMGTCQYRDLIQSNKEICLIYLATNKKTGFNRRK